MSENPEPQTGPAVTGEDADRAAEGGRPVTQVEGETADSDQKSLEERELESRMPGGPNRAPSDPRNSEATDSTQLPDRPGREWPETRTAGHSWIVHRKPVDGSPSREHAQLCETGQGHGQPCKGHGLLERSGRWAACLAVGPRSGRNPGGRAVPPVYIAA